ncbi:MAG: DUF362 domain-containing protein [Candidatus Sabulitectum sp.]|nr:DUF362 domain-containing protein [Candidatus Sabulitectum sp.]
MSVKLGLARSENLSGVEMYDPATISTLIDEAIKDWSGTDSGGLQSLIAPGSKVVIKPNYVRHPRNDSLGQGCMITNTQIIIEVIKRVSLCHPREIILGDAPIQGCIWEKLVTEQMRNSFHQACGSIPLRIVDFRRTLYQSGMQTENVRPESNYVLFDLKKSSYLEPISTRKNSFRVGMYDHRKLNKTHAKGIHQYLVAKEIIDADVVISIPKLKTHKKAGITGALKNLIGINGNKEFLPHHRKGSVQQNGDCYLKRNILKTFIENLNDYAYMCKKLSARKIFLFIRKVVSLVHRKLGGIGDIGGNWYGNDTVWRTALDLNRILYYGTAAGDISVTKQRKVLTITDAVICGQGDGPLNPEPLLVGVITVTDRTDVADYFHSIMLGMVPETIPLVANASSVFGKDADEEIALIYKGKTYKLTDRVFDYPVAKLPEGWERDNSSNK